MHTLEQLKAGELTGSRQLRLACGLTEFPREIFDLADTLEILDLSGNALSSLPDDLHRLQKLRILFASNNQFTALPEALGRCPELSMVGFKANRIHDVPGQALPPKLRWLILTDNAVEALPDKMGMCRHLQKLMLAGNRLRALPDSMAGLVNLELLRIAANQLIELPTWLPTLPRLSWLAFAGNPFCADLEARGLAETTMPIAWADIDLQQLLGEGASGYIYRALYRNSDPVAVKIFKGAVTSDGLPSCEMAACLSAGTHPNLIPVRGKVADSPEGQALVMDLINPAFGNLAGPPSLESCTRDIYAPDTRFEPAAVLAIARGIASVGRHLHAHGLMHGDLYAHNILYDGAQALIGDFGAASFYDSDTGALERLEVRAFGCLLEELIERCPAADSGLTDIRNACLHIDPDKRPRFTEIERALSRL